MAPVAFWTPWEDVLDMLRKKQPQGKGSTCWSQIIESNVA